MSSFFERNTTLKIISIAIALILWSMTPSNRDPVRDMSFRNIPIKVENQQKLSENGLMISTEMPDTYSFDIRAKASMVKFLDRSKIIALVNLSEINKTGEQGVSVELQGLPSTSSVEIKSAPDIKIRVERIVSKTVPVLPKVEDDDSLELGRRYYEINPRFVEVRGPESLMETAAYAQIPIVLGSRDKKLERSLIVQLLNDMDEIMDPKFITTTPQYCVITVYPNKVVKVEPTITGRPADGYVVVGTEINPEEVTINGNPEILNTITAISTDILDIEGATGSVMKEVKIQQPEGIRISPGQATLVQVLVRIERVVDKKVSLGNIELRNKADELKVIPDDIDKDISVVIRGPQSLVNSFKSDDLNAYVDLNNSSRGERTYSIYVDKLSAGLEIMEIKPSKLKINLR